MDASLKATLKEGLRAHRAAQPQAAERCYQRVLKQAPDNVDALSLLGLLRQQQGRPTQARPLLEQAVSIRPDHAQSLGVLCEVLLSLGEADAAEMRAKALLAVDSRNARAHYCLGSALYLQGKLQPAADALHAALEHQPKAADALNLLALVQARHNNLEAALACAQKAHQLAPGNPDFANNLGFLLLESGDPAAALPLLQSFIAARPDSGEGLVNLGRALHQLGRDTEAIQTFGRAREIDPSVAAVAINTGISLQALGRSREAEQAYLDALELAPDNLAALANLATLYESTNQLQAAASTAARGLELDPQHAFLNLVMAKCERRAGEFDTACGRLHGVLAKKPERRWQRALNYELARCEDRAGRTGEAMAAATQANRLAAAHWQQLGQSENPFNRMLADLDRATRGGWIESWQALPRPGPGPADPVFLVGFPRSGTTLLDTVIGSHPDFLVLEEQPAVDRLREQLMGSAVGLPAALSAMQASDQEKLRAAYWQAVEDALPEQAADRQLLDKLPLNIVLLPLIARVFPQSRVIVMLRHPADVCLSCYFQEFDYLRATAMTNFFTMDSTVAFYGQVMGLWEQYRQRLPMSFCEVRYEDLVSDMEAETRRLFDFLDCPWNPLVLDFHRHSAVDRTIDTPSYHQVSQPVYTHSRYRYKSYAGHLEPWLDTLQAWAQKLGYGERSGDG